MVEPYSFYPNIETMQNNYQSKAISGDFSRINSLALREHRNFRNKLSERGVNISWTKGLNTCPDDLFCNNWVSTHSNGQFNLYSMYAKNRRLEKRVDLIHFFREFYQLHKDYSNYENNDHFLESTGSLVLDRKNKKAYAVKSERTNENLVNIWCKDNAYEPVVFNATT